eukprot:CAMPEP_0197918110 /NCGR_PEP_ID=MMETSP1439-20131203/84895_1 /TAXON_ID=66791 /ORGANISM="Gonyaulax spinifera, Strain CCMP409" /LENGTH=70 /DNA_ID=CAMNT_0043540211 /DNA_START=63 /DNA_END=271 /DNA_ORIENTATION=-
MRIWLPRCPLRLGAVNQRLPAAHVCMSCWLKDQFGSAWRPEFYAAPCWRTCRLNDHSSGHRRGAQVPHVR